MNTTIIGLLILAGVAVLAAGAYIAQTIEKNREARRMQIRELRSKSRRASNMAAGIPAAFLPDNLRQFLISYALTQNYSILELEGDAAARTAIQELNQLQQAEHQHQLDQAKPVFNDINAAKRCSVALKDLANFLVSLYKQGALEKSNAQKLVNQSKMMYLLSGAEVDLLNADQFAQQGNPKAALQYCIRAKTRLKPFADQGQIPQRRRYIDLCLQKFKQQAGATQAAANKGQPADQVAKEWAEFEENAQEDWKKKQDYE